MLNIKAMNRVWRVFQLERIRNLNQLLKNVTINSSVNFTKTSLPIHIQNSKPRTNRTRCLPSVLALFKINTVANATNTDKNETLQESEDSNTKTEAAIVNVTFITNKGKEVKTRGKVGDNLLLLAQKYQLEVEGACERSLKCTTCHVYIKDDYFDLVEEATERELDLLDTAKFLKPNSRLSCAVHLTKEMDGMQVNLPMGTVNFYVDGHKPTPH